MQSLNQVTWIKLNKEEIIKRKNDIEGIVADLSSNKLDEQWQRFLAYQTLQGMPIYNHLQIYESLTGRSPIQHLHENNLGSLQPSILYLAVKRIMDIVLVVITLPIFLIIFALTYIAITLESKGKAIFVQQRVGLGGRVFDMYKFRSMYQDAPNLNQAMTQVNDPRITRVGRFIRKTRIDELPQFINVLKGQMSLIGPRPELPNMVKELDEKIPFYTYRQIVKPGISGWAQVMQGNDHVDDIKTKLEYDFYYIKNFSLTLDLLIVIKTIQTMLTGFGAR
jgi:exopolysaccharide biosynthesis polyprenyl glycosylphosphotransferase